MDSTLIRDLIQVPLTINDFAFLDSTEATQLFSSQIRTFLRIFRVGMSPPNLFFKLLYG